jgi:mxaL protein
MTLMHYLRSSWRVWLLLSAIVLLVATFADPTVTLERTGSRYIFVFDVTQSMNVSDAGPHAQNRLSFAEQVLDQALTLLPCSSAAGLALFSGHRTFLLFTPVPVCTHYGELVAMINTIDWRMAWEASSEVAKGLHASIEITEQLNDDTRLVFITDGHEAPPLHQNFRPAFRGEPGKVKGLIIGVGGLQPMPIPKLDNDGRLLGYWQPHEVMQVDRYSLGRGGTEVGGEQMVGVDSSDVTQRIQSGSEHLSSLHESYLQQLAAETGLGYHRLRTAADFTAALTAAQLAHSEPAATDLRWLLALVALLLVLSLYIDFGRLPALRSIMAWGKS